MKSIFGRACGAARGGGRKFSDARGGGVDTQFPLCDDVWFNAPHLLFLSTLMHSQIEAACFTLFAIAFGSP